MAMTGQPDSPPTRSGVSVADLAAGVFGAFAILAALTYREKSGHGQLVDVSMFDCVFNLLTYNLTYVQTTGHEPGRSGGRHPTIVPMGCFTTMDGFIVIAAFNNNFWLNLCDAVDRPEWREDSRFIRMRDRAAHQAELFAELDELLSRKTTREWEEVFAGADVPFGPVWSVGDLLTQPHVSARRLLAEVNVANETSEVNPWQVAVRPVKYSAFDSGVLKQPPRLGEDTSRVLADMLGLSAPKISELAARGIIRIDESPGQ